MNTEELQKEIWFLYGLWYKYYDLQCYIQKHKKNYDLISILREKQNECLRIIDRLKDEI